MAAWNWPKYGIFVLLSPASIKFRKNIEILWKGANSAARLRIPHSTKNVVPNYEYRGHVNLPTVYTHDLSLLQHYWGNFFAMQVYVWHETTCSHCGETPSCQLCVTSVILSVLSVFRLLYSRWFRAVVTCTLCLVPVLTVSGELWCCWFTFLVIDQFVSQDVFFLIVGVIVFCK